MEAQAGRHHPRRRAHPRRGVRGVLGISELRAQRVRAAGRRAARHARAHRGAASSTTSATCRRRSVEHLATVPRRGPRPLGARRPPGAASSSTPPPRCTVSAPTPGSYLEAAALLANVGLSISHSKHHKHTYYVIRNSDRLVGSHRPRDRADRPGRPLPPQERARSPRTPSGRRSIHPTRSWCGCARRCCGSPSASTAVTRAASARSAPRCGPTGWWSRGPGRRRRRRARALRGRRAHGAAGGGGRPAGGGPDRPGVRRGDVHRPHPPP